MAAHRARRATDALIDLVPWPSTIIGVALIVIFGLCVAGLTWPPVESAAPSAPVGVVAITPDDPAAPTPVPVQSLGR